MSRQANNSLELQLRYFEYCVQFNPRDETARFALAQVLHEMGRQREADDCYDAGILLANRLWLAKLPIFILVSGGIAGILWLAGLRWTWLPPVLIAVGVTLWLIIRHNRQRWLPQTGFWQRQGTIEELNLAEEIERIEQDLRQNEAAT